MHWTFIDIKINGKGGIFFAKWIPIATPGLKLIALSLPFKFIVGFSGVQPPYWEPQSHSASSLLFVPNPSRQSPSSAFLPFPTPRVCIECVPTFPFLFRISCMWESLLSSSCAAYTADWCARLWALPAFCNVSCPDLWTEHAYQLVPPDIVGWSHTFHRLSILSVSFFQSNFLFWTSIS